MIFLLFSLITMAVSVASALGLAFLFQGLGFWTAAMSLSLGLVTSFIVIARLPGSSQKKEAPSAWLPRSFWEWLVAGVFVIACAREFLWLIYDDGNAIKVLCHNNEGDLSLHVTFIRYLAVAPHWWPANPILIHAPLRYYIGMDLFNSLLLLVGVPLEQGLIWVGLIGATLTGLALWRWGRAFAIAAFLFNGGLAAIVLLRGIDPEVAAQWKNIFLSLFLTQRGFLYALPAGLLLLSTWRESYFPRSEDEKFLVPLSLQALLLGTMPLFHVYAFLFLSAIMVSVMVFSVAARKSLLKLALLAWPLALLFLGIIARGGHSTFGWHPGWMQEGPALWFWFFNFGISLPLALFLVVILFFRSSSRPETRELRAFVWPSALIFVFCLFIRIAPWAWDNTKLMIWSWLTIAPFIWRELIAPWRWWVRGILCVLLFGTGAITLVSWLDGHHDGTIIQRSEVAQAAALINYLPPDAVIAIAPEFNHPVLWLGHPVVTSYSGHVWSHGLSFKKQIADLYSIMNGEQGWESKARGLGIAAIYWGPREKKEFINSKLPFAHQQEAPLLYEINKL